MSTTVAPITQEIPKNIIEVKQGLVCVNIDFNTGACKTWAIMRQPEPLLPKISHTDMGILTVKVIGLLVLAWVFTMLKKAI